MPASNAVPYAIPPSAVVNTVDITFDTNLPKSGTPYTPSSQDSPYTGEITSPILTVDGVKVGYLTVQNSKGTFQGPVTFSWDVGSTHTYSWEQVVLFTANKRYSFDSASGVASGQSGTITVSSGGTVTANYKDESLLSVVIRDGSNSGNICSSCGTVSTQAGWYTTGSTVQIQAIPSTGYTFLKSGIQPISVGAGSGPMPSFQFSTQNPMTVTMDTPKNIAVYFQLVPDFSLTLNQSILNIPAGEKTVVILTILPKGNVDFNNIILQPTYPSGGYITANLLNDNTVVTTSDYRQMQLEISVDRNTPPGTYLVGVLGTLGSMSHNVNLTVKVSSSTQSSPTPTPATSYKFDGRYQVTFSYTVDYGGGPTPGQMVLYFDVKNGIVSHPQNIFSGTVSDAGTVNVTYSECSKFTNYSSPGSVTGTLSQSGYGDGTFSCGSALYGSWKAQRVDQTYTPPPTSTPTPTPTTPSTPTPTPKSTKTLLYENKQYGFSIKYPSNFQKSETLEKDSSNPHRITIVTFQPASTTYYGIGFSDYEPLYMGLSDQQFLAKMKQEASTGCSPPSCSNLKFLDASATTHANGYKMYATGATATISTDKGSTDSLVIMAYIPDGNDMWSLFLVSFSQDEFKQFGTAITSSFQTFTINDYQGVKTSQTTKQTTTPSQPSTSTLTKPSTTQTTPTLKQKQFQLDVKASQKDDVVTITILNPKDSSTDVYAVKLTTVNGKIKNYLKVDGWDYKRTGDNTVMYKTKLSPLKQSNVITIKLKVDTKNTEIKWEAFSKDQKSLGTGKVKSS